MGKFSDIGSKSAAGGRNYFQPGVYLAEILGIRYKPSGFRGESYVIDFEIKDVLLAKPAEERDGVKFEASRAIGDKVAHVIKLDGEFGPTLGMGNLADFLRAVGATMKAHDGELVVLKDVEVDESDVETSYSPEQPFVGLQLEIHVQGTKTEKKGNAFSVITYKVPRDLVATLEAEAA